jgi:hypothetical protein
MAFDPATGQLILFGGLGNVGFFNDTWNWDGTTWTQLSPATSPPARGSASLAFDSATGQMILFGGNDFSTFFGDTWSWNGTTWTQLTPATSPSGRSEASMAFDPATGQLILFGGLGSSGVLNETWNWNGTTWTQLSPATSPSTLLGTSMAFDQATGQLILFGGANGGFHDDTWSWDGTTTTWTQLSPTAAPSARFFSIMDFDQATGQLILFGGQDISGELADTWNWGIEPLILTATPPSQTICSGSTTSIALSSNMPGTTFSWMVVESGVTGASAGSGSSIAQTLNTTTNAAGTATYTVTPTSPGGCSGSPITVVVTVNPAPIAMATPPSDTICSGDTTSIALSSNVPSTTFSWTVVESGVTGASDGSGSSIAQTLNTTTNATGTATYTITPSANGCTGDSITLIVTVTQCSKPPQHFRGIVEKDKFATQTDIINKLSWMASNDPNAIGYKLYQNGELIDILPINQTTISLHNRSCDKCYTYELFTFNINGVESEPATVILCN